MRSYCPKIPRPVSPQAWLCLHAGAGVACLVMADWLFFKHSVGVSFALFLCFLALVCAGVNPLRANKKEIKLAISILAAGIAAVVYDFNFLSFCFGTAALALFSQILSGAKLRMWLDRARQYRRFFLVGYVWLPRDLIRAMTLWRGRRTKKPLYARLILWIIPLVFGSIFLALFAEANPIIANVLGAINLNFLWRGLSPSRVFFWLFILGLVWPYLHMPNARPGKAKAARTRNSVVDRLKLQGLFSNAVLLRSLILFNVLFAVQTCLDMAYLWGGLHLPDNLTYADYAHRGAYPLCCTALIAAAFVLAASSNFGAAGPTGRLRTLLMLWVGQNLVLVLSSLLRLDLYVAAYSLTTLRVEAFIWMGLVGLGLILISLKIYWRKSSAWLIGANALTTGVTLYLCCFVNFNLMIANYNIAHAYSQVVEGQNKLDEIYLRNLGIQVIPALDAYIKASRLNGRDVKKLERTRRFLAYTFYNEQQDWRAFGLESWSLNRYLASQGEPAASRPASGPEH